MVDMQIVCFFNTQIQIVCTNSKNVIQVLKHDIYWNRCYTWYEIFKKQQI